MDEAGFKAVTRWADARADLESRCEPHGRTEDVAVTDAVDRVLADAIAARRDVPHYDRAAADGYAVRAADTYSASTRSPARLDVAEGAVTGRGAVPVDAGDVVPNGADAVVAVESTTRRNGELAVSDAVAPGENVTSTGADVETGQQLFESGRRLQPSDLAVLHAAGHTSVAVTARPRVSVIPTGDELVAADTEPDPGAAVETDGLLVSTLAERWGGAATRRDVVADDETALQTAIEADADHDVVVTTGGSSVGARDVVAAVVADAGEVAVHGIAIDPGQSAGFGVVDDTPVLVLPGAPVSCLAAAVQFLRPALAWLTGTTPRPHPAVRAQLTEKIHSEPGERTFARVGFVSDQTPDDWADTTADADEPPGVEPVRVGGAGVTSNVSFADGWVVVPESREGIPAGEVVTVEEWDRPDVAGPSGN